MAAMSLNPDDEHNRYRNVTICHVAAPEVFRFIVEHGASDKKIGETYFNYLKRKGLTTTAIKKHFGKVELEKIKKCRDCKTFDVTDMVQLIKIGCSSLASPGDDIWNDNSDTERVEPLIHQVKNYRNEVCHNKTATCPHTFNEVRELLIKLINATGILYKLSQADIDKEKNRLLKVIEEIEKGNYERDMEVCKVLFSQLANEENTKYWSKHGSKTIIPFNSMVVEGDVFHSIEMILKAEIVSGINTKQPYEEILDQCISKEDTPVTIIVGEAGSGKTTALKSVARQILKLAPQTLKVFDSSKFDVLYYYECRSTSSNSFQRLVEITFPVACLKVDPKKIVDLFLSMNNFIIIDGYDEINMNSGIVVSDIASLLTKASETCRCLITTRPHMLRKLKNLLNSMGLSYVVCNISDITESADQIAFLSKYENSNIPAPGLSKTFASLVTEVRRYFTSPIRLVFFFFLYLSYSTSVCSWKNEYDVLIYTWHYYVDTLLNKLQNINIANEKSFVKEILLAVGRSAFQCLALNKIALTDAEYQPLLDDCTTILAKYKVESLVDVRYLLSAVLKTNDDHQTITFAFDHKSIQEFFASKAFIEALKEHCTSDIGRITKQLGKISRDSLINK